MSDDNTDKLDAQYLLRQGAQSVLAELARFAREPVPADITDPNHIRAFRLGRLKGVLWRLCAEFGVEVES